VVLEVDTGKIQGDSGIALLLVNRGVSRTKAGPSAPLENASLRMTR
jgi:hypothetical protein